jgi:hypothetical protein
VKNDNIVTNQAAIDAWLLRDVTCGNYILARNEQQSKENPEWTFSLPERCG